MQDMIIYTIYKITNLINDKIYIGQHIENGNTSQVSVNDPRYLSGELVSINKGRRRSKENIEYEM